MEPYIVSPQRYHRIDQDATNPGQRFGYNNTGFSNYADVTSILQGDKKVRQGVIRWQIFL